MPQERNKKMNEDEKTKCVIVQKLRLEYGGQVQDYLQPIAVCDDYEEGLVFAETETVKFVKEIFREAEEANAILTFGAVFIYDYNRFYEKVIRDREFRLRILNWLERNFDISNDEIRSLRREGSKLDSEDINPRAWETFGTSSGADSLRFVTSTRQDFSNSPIENSVQPLAENFVQLVLNAEFKGEFAPDGREILEIISTLDEHLFEVFEVMYIQPSEFR